MNGLKPYTESEVKGDNKALIFILIGSFMTLRWARKRVKGTVMQFKKLLRYDRLDMKTKL